MYTASGGLLAIAELLVNALWSNGRYSFFVNVDAASGQRNRQTVGGITDTPHTPGRIVPLNKQDEAMDFDKLVYETAL